MSKERIEFIDLAKGFCIILVVMHHIQVSLHVNLPIDNFQQIFRMPLYFFLSGLFFKTYENFGGFIKRKTNKLLIPFFFFFLVTSILLPYIASNFLNYKITDAENLGIGSLWSFIYPERFVNTPIWFLWGLFVLNIIFYMVFLFSERLYKYKLAVLVSGSLFIGIMGYTLGRFNINLPAFIDSAMTAMPFYCAGFLINKFTNMLRPNAFDKYMILIVLLCGVVAWISSYGGVHYMRNTYDISIFFLYIGGIAGTLMIVYFAKLFKYIPCISYWGRYSIIVLVTHQPLIRLYSSVVKCFFKEDIVVLFVTLVMMMMSYLIIIPFMKRFFPYVTAQKDLIKI